MQEEKRRKSAKRAKSAAAAVSESPVVSDDDGIDITNVDGGRVLPDVPEELLLNAAIEHLSDDGLSVASLSGDSSGEEEIPSAVSESSSEDEGDANPVGDIPMRWYEGYEHIGYDRSGERILPKNRPSALELAADPHAWRRVYDEKNDEELVLTHKELKAIAKLRVGRYPGASHDGPDQEVIAWTGAPRTQPLGSGTEPKRRFLPSRHEARLVVRIVRGMRDGSITRPGERKRAPTEESLYRYDIWDGHAPPTFEDMTKSQRAREIMHVPAPKVPLPRHDESYNPPEEYLPTEKEQLEWEKTAPEDRASNYLPKKESALRHVPLYENFIKERFERCLDLYLAVRMKKDPTRINPEDLVPKLPSPRDLRPFPSGRSLRYGPLPSRARSIDVHPGGQWLLSGSDDGVVRLWEVGTGFLRAAWNLGKRLPMVDGKAQPVMRVEWRPSVKSFVFAAALGTSLLIVGAGPALGLEDEEAEELFMVEEEEEEATREDVEESKPDENDADNKEEDEEGAEDTKRLQRIDWKEHKREVNGSKEEQCRILEVVHPRTLRVCTWHRKGEYLATVGKDSNGGTVVVHRVTKRSSRILFRRRSAGVQCVRFHPTRPFFFVATMHHVRIYNLALEQAVKTLKPGVRWISSVDVHPSGDHLLVTSYDRRTCWFDLDLSIRPYKTLRNHEKAVRSARFHQRLPLFATAADDAAVHVFHGMVYDDLSKNALIVPLKKLNKAHRITDSLGVLDIAWHPRMPWLFTSGADRGLHLFTDTS